MKWFRRPVRAFVSGVLLVGLLPTVPGVGSLARAQTEEVEKRIYVGDGQVIESAGGTTTMGFPIVLSEEKENGMQITYSTSVEDGDSATEGDDFIPVEAKTVTLPTANNVWTGRRNVLPAEESPIVVEVNADDPSAADDVFETLSLDLSVPNGSDWELVFPSARGVIVDDPGDFAVQTGTHVYVSDSPVLEPAEGTTELSFQVLAMNHTSEFELTYSAFTGPDDTANEGEDFTPVDGETVTLKPGSGTGADLVHRVVTMPVTVHADEISAADDLVETFTVEFEPEEGSDVTVVRGEARGVIVDETDDATTACVFDPAAGTMVVTNIGAEITISRSPVGKEILVGAECVGGTPTVETVDLVVIETVGNGFVTVPTRVTLDLRGGPFAPGIDHEDVGYVDAFAGSEVSEPAVDGDGTVPDVEGPEVSPVPEDDTPEIEFDVRYPYNVGMVQVIGSDGPDRVIAGWQTCQDDPDPDCSLLNVNLNADADADADVKTSLSTQRLAGDSSDTTISASSFEEVAIRGGGGDDVLSLAGGHGTGDPLPPRGGTATGGGVGRGVLSTVLDGGAGDDRLVGSDLGSLDASGAPLAVEEIRGGSGDDVLVGAGGLDTLRGDAGNDVFDQGPEPDGADAIHGGSGHDVVDYSERATFVEVDTGDGEANDGARGEQDDVKVDVEEALLPSSVSRPEPVPGFEVVGELKNAARCRPRSSPFRHGTLFHWTIEEFGPCPMLVDDQHHLGVSAGFAVDLDQSLDASMRPRSRIMVYDLERLEAVAAPEATSPFDFERAVIDPSRRRVYGPGDEDWTTPNSRPVNNGTCSVPYIDYGDDPATELTGVPEPRSALLTYEFPGDDHCVPLVEQPVNPVPTNPAERNVAVFEAGRRLPLTAVGVAFDEDHDDLYLSGLVGGDTARRGGHPTQNSPLPFYPEWLQETDGQALILRKVHLEGDAGAVAEWDLDLRYAGCGRRNPRFNDDPVWAAFVGRVGDDLLAYCWDSRVLWDFPGEQGYLVRIPLDPETGKPLPREGTGDDLITDANGAYVNYRAVRTPTLPGSSVRVLHDPASDTLLLVTTDTLNGNAAYAFDPASDSFVGVAAGGALSQPIANDAAGLDPVKGRVYLLTADGVVVFPTRVRPLPGGRLFPVATNNPFRPYRDWANNSVISVVPSLGRLFIPINSQFDSGGFARWLVVDDTTPDLPTQSRDPDVNTTQVEEGPDTEVRSFAEGTASGVHVVYVGGPVRTVDSADPACFAKVDFSVVDEEASLESEIFGNGACAADQVVTPGHREFSLAASGSEAASGTAAVAEASGLAFDENDMTTRDVEAVGGCEAGLLASLTRGGFSSPEYDDGCDQFWDGATGQGEAASDDPRDPRGEVPDPRAGTRGRDGRGFPVPGVSCSDFGGSPKSPEPAGTPAVASAQVSCDVAGVSATAASEAAAFTVSQNDAPLISVARSESSTTTAKTAEGQVTVSAAKAEGVVAGPLSIREVRSVAVTRAKGRTGTAVTELERRWCGVTFDGSDPVATTMSSTTTTAPVEVPVPTSRAATTNCIDPTSAENAKFLEELNFALGGKVRITVTRANEETEDDGTVEEGEDSPGGYEAVLIKYDDARGGDAAVNDDDSITVAGLQAVVYNDGPKGRNRIVVQLAGVHAESRYGITELPDFSGFDGFTGFFQEPTFTPGSPGTPGFTIPGASELVEGETFETVIITRGRPGVGATDPIDNLLQWVPEAVKDLLRLLVQHPLEFLLLFGVFSLLAAPAYMAHRRRQFRGLVAS